MTGHATIKNTLIQAIEALDDQELADRSVLIVQQKDGAVAVSLPDVDLKEPSPLTEYEKEVLREGGYNTETEEIISVAENTARAFDALIQRSLNVQEAARRLHVHESRIRQRITGKPPSLYAFKVGGEWFIPLFQIRGKKLVHGIEKVIAVLDPALHPLEVFAWFHNPDPDLTRENDSEPMSPLEWLKAGYDPKAVIELAQDM